MDKVLIVKKDNGKLTAKVRRRMHKGYVPDDYRKIINPEDYNDLALLFEDLDVLISAPIDKAYKKYIERKNGKFPFF